jgi:trans-aconitate 2-methyltransferase
MPTWDDAQYLMFANERTRPARELLRRVPVAAPGRVVDLGCGPGNSTELLRERWPEARLTGVDSSPEMLERARRELPDIEWVQADADRYVAGEPVDVLYSNALLQWIPGHESLVPALFEQLAPGGALAFQVPHNFTEPSHRLMRETAAAYGERLTHVRATDPVGSPAFYYDLLAPRARSVDVWQTTYEHVMADALSIVEWVKGTGLRPFLEALAEAERPGFLDAYTRAIDAAYPRRSDGRRLFSFPRLFVVAVR